MGSEEAEGLFFFLQVFDLTGEGEGWGVAVDEGVPLAGKEGFGGREELEEDGDGGEG
jgi:hypothetical protein